MTRLDDLLAEKDRLNTRLSELLLLIDQERNRVESEPDGIFNLSAAETWKIFHEGHEVAATDEFCQYRPQYAGERLFIQTIQKQLMGWTVTLMNEQQEAAYWRVPQDMAKRMRKAFLEEPDHK